MTTDQPGQPSSSRNTLQLVLGVLWAFVMLVATFALDNPGNTVPFWLLLIAYYIVTWGRRGR